MAVLYEVIEKIRSGGQTGVDRAALDAALELGMPCGGWCPAGRWAEDGPIDPVYPLTETPSGHPEERTAWNVRDSDATLILSSGPLDEGTALTLRKARELEKPVLLIDLSAAPDLAGVARWMTEHQVRELNVAGPRATSDPRLYTLAHAFLKRFLTYRPESQPDLN